MEPLIYTQIRKGKNKSKKVEREGKITGQYATQVTWKYEDGKEKKNPIKLREEQMRSQDKPVLRAPKTAISP